MSHSLFSPSSAHRWLNCPGSMAFPENTADGGSSSYADDGTASHTLAACALTQNRFCDTYLGRKINVNGTDYEVDEERASFTQVYVDDVLRRAMGGHLLVEQEVDLSPYFGNGQMGTSDAIIFQPEQKLLIVEDLKYGMGEKVYAKRSAQGLSYALGALALAELFGEVERIQIVICQPRIGHLDEWECSIGELMEFAADAQRAIDLAGKAMYGYNGDQGVAVPYLRPGDKTCRWCRAKSRCPALAKLVAADVGRDFDVIAADPPQVPTDTLYLSQAMIAVPLIEDWCRAVKAEVHRLVANGTPVIGPDGLPYKYVQGDEGKRQWRDEMAAEAALLGQLPEDKIYKPREIITAPVAGKLLDKKATKQLWKEIFMPLIGRKKGGQILAQGSDPRPAYSNAAAADEFNEIGVES